MMKSSAFRSAVSIGSAIAAATTLCFAQVDPVTLRIAVQPRPTVALAGPLTSVPRTAPSGNYAFGLVTSINGEPARGAWSDKVVILQSIPLPNTYLQVWTFNLAEADGTPAGVISATGIVGKPGALLNEDLRIVNSTNAYDGIEGTVRLPGISSGPTTEIRPLSDQRPYELIFVATLTPANTPRVATRDGGPAIAHGKDSAPVTSDAPAEPGEILTLVATDLMPELTEPGDWPSEPEAVANLPVKVKVAGLNAKILYIGRYPGARSAYQINFQLPADMRGGMVDVQISTGFIGGPATATWVR
jgi:hypothetical protein